MPPPLPSSSTAGTASRRVRSVHALAGLTLLSAACSTPAPDLGTPTWRCELRWSADHRQLDGLLRLPPGEAVSLRAPEPSAAFFRFDEGAAERLVRAAPHERRVVFHLELVAAAQGIDDERILARSGRGFVGSLTTLLPVPAAANDASMQLTVVPPPDERFACVLQRRGADWFATAADLADAPSCCFGAIAVQTLHLPDLLAHVEVAHLAVATPETRTAFDQHLAAAVRATTAWFERFPVDRLLVIAIPVAGRSIVSGNVRGDGGACVRLHVPRHLEAATLADDWVVFHEFVHLALPSLAATHRWFDEGAATYVEPLLQASLGRQSPEAVWRARFDEYSQGVPTPGSGGLDDDASWGRTYYGGATFCLLADLRIRAATDGRRSLRHALAGVVAAGGSVTTSWSLQEVLERGDAATGTTVLQDLYAQYGSRDEVPDLDAIWRELGIAARDGGIVLDDAEAPTGLRRALVPGPSLGAPRAQSPR